MELNNNISYKTIVYNLIGLLIVRDSHNDYKGEYIRVMKEIVDKIENANFIIAGNRRKVKIKTTDVLDTMRDIHGTILLCTDKYLKGEIVGANSFFNTQWKKIKIGRYEERLDGKVFYRMRRKKEGDKEFRYSDLLHISIENREKVMNQRFSANGFPCLYASTSLYQSWEELRRPNLQNLYAAGLMFTEKMNLLDLRLIRTINDQKQLKAFIERLPLIIACSIKVRSEGVVFKDEYLISQILMHTIINKNNKIDGILYSSMRKDYDYYKADSKVEDCSRNENIVVPAKIRNEGNIWHDKLLEMIEISDPSNFEQELIKGRIAYRKNKTYEKTIFGQMESILMNSRTYYPVKRNKFANSWGLGFPKRLQESKNMIHLI